MIGLLKYYIKKRAYIVGIISFIVLLLAITILRGGYIDRYESYTGEIIERAQNSPITYYTVASLILVTIIPLFEFSFKMKKVSVDEFYKFPIRREKLYLVKFIIGLMEVLIPMTILFIYTFVDIAISEHLFNIGAYLLFYFLSIPVLFATYSLITFIYAKCNTIHDGIINVVMIQFLFVAISWVIFEFFNLRDVCAYGDINYPYQLSIGCSNHFELFFAYSPICILSDKCSNYMLGDPFFGSALLGSDIIEIVSMIFFFIIGIVSFVLLITNLKNDKSENSMDISNSWFSYKVMIPIFISTLTILSCSNGDTLILLLIIAISGYIGYAIYRRNFKIKWCDVITMSSSLIGGIIIGAILWNLQ